MSTDKPVIVEREFSHFPWRIWQAITEADEMKEWFFEEINSFEPIEGFVVDFDIRLEGRNFIHLWEILEVEKEKRIVYDWRYGGYKGESTVTFEIEKTNDGALLRVIHHGIQSFPKDRPEFSYDSCKEGWEFFIHQKLRNFLESKL